MPLISLTTPQGLALNIPDRSILSIEECREGKVPHIAEQCSFIRFDIGQGVRVAHVIETFDNVKDAVGKGNPAISSWFTYNLWEAGHTERELKDRICFDPSRIIMYQGLDPTHEVNEGAETLMTVDFGQRDERGPVYENFALLIHPDKVKASLLR